jgi:hypothetical protein
VEDQLELSSTQSEFNGKIRGLKDEDLQGEQSENSDLRRTATQTRGGECADEKTKRQLII